MTKVCPKCGITKDKSDFQKSKQFKDGIRPWCKSCVSIYNKERYKRKSEEIRKRVTEYRLANPTVIKARKKSWAQKNASRITIKVQNRNFAMKGKQLDYGIVELLRMEQAGKCSGCLEMLSDKGEHLDHFTPLSLGGSHENNNIQLLCPQCNIRKSNKHPMQWLNEVLKTTDFV